VLFFGLMRPADTKNAQMRPATQFEFETPELDNQNRHNSIFLSNKQQHNKNVKKQSFFIL
jgi:hypothetical protein